MLGQKLKGPLERAVLKSCSKASIPNSGEIQRADPYFTKECWTSPGKTAKVL